MVNITPAAVAEIKRIQLNRQMTNASLRLVVKTGGCLDFFYDLTFESRVGRDELQIAKSDRVLEINGINLVVDDQSWQYIESLNLDYGEDLMGGGFRFHNSLSHQTCGCGISFAKSK
jgi:iron-sulfur cluster assembly protein